MRNLPVSADRIAADIAALADITEPDRPFTRRAFTTRFLEGRSFLAGRFRAAGLEVHVDASGNLTGRRRGRQAGGGTILIGSHSDTVPDGGRFDGVAGVVVALEVARALADAGIALDHDLEVVDFLAEEVSIFGVSCIGSRGMAGTRPAEWLTREHDGLSLAKAIAEVGGDPSVLQARSDVRAFLELHIEQGPVLENEKRDIGVVTSIAGITRFEIVVEGRADHAGTTPMGARCDALVAASRLVIAIEAQALAQSRGAHHFAATVGEFDISPNAANVVPSHVRMLIDARAERREDMETFSAALDKAVDDMATTGVTITVKRISDAAAVPMDAGLIDTFETASDSVGASHRRMASGAGHDAAHIARIARAGMIFIPCRMGRSHTPDEWAENDDIALGAAVMFEAVRALDRKLSE